MNRYHIALLLAASPTALHAAQAPLFSAPSISCVENGPCNLVINKSAVAKSYSKLQVRTVDGTAKAGVDYQPVDTVLTIGNNTLRVSVPIPLIDNATYQGSRTFAVALIPLRNAQVAASMSAPTIVTINDDEVAPPPPPPPPSTGGGEADIADNFDVNAWLEPGEAPHPSPDEVGAFRFTCLVGQLLKDDPIVYPGQPGKSHLHQFFGNTLTNANSTYQSLRTTGGSTCTRSATESPQRSAYWMPAMLDGIGNAIKADWMNTYYKQLPASDPNCAKTVDPANGAIISSVQGKCIPIPNGLRFILGYNMATGEGGPLTTNQNPDSEYWKIVFDCMTSDGTNVSYLGQPLHSIKAVVDSGKCPTGAWLRVAVTFPQCWDGKNLDSADHRSHMRNTWGSNGCPSTHPYRVPEIAISANFRVDPNFAKWHLSSDEMLPGAIPGQTLHMDYWEGWSPIVKAIWQKNCIDGHLTCSAGSVGDGREIKGMQQVGAFPNHVLVPLSSIP